MREEELEMELTAGDVYDRICEQVALARTRALMGERAEALHIFQVASLDYDRFRDVLAGLPLHSLDHDFTTTRQILSVERCLSEFAPIGPTESVPVISVAQSRTRSRRRATKAA